MSSEKTGAPYAEPPPPYNSTSGGYNQPPSSYGQGGAPGMTIFPGPSHPPPPGGVPIFPMAGFTGYPSPPPPAQTVVVGSPSGAPGTVPVTSVTVVNVAQCGPYPMQVSCPHCGAQVMTETTAVPGLLTWLLSGGLILLGCWLGCCLIPCCIPDCQDIEHKCPNCKQHLGTYRRI